VSPATNTVDKVDPDSDDNPSIVEMLLKDTFVPVPNTATPPVAHAE
jgi:hypothetical protein